MRDGGESDMTTGALVGVIDDDDDVRDSICALLDSAGHAVRGYSSARAFLDDENSAVGCLIADIRMPEMDGMQLLAELSRRETGFAVIMMTGHGDVPLAVRAMRAGALDFIEKPFEDDDFLERIERALEIGKRVRDDLQAASVAKNIIALLTPRERNVLDQLVIGRSNKIVAYELGISPRTVEIHRAHIMTKMKVRSFSELIRIALAAQKIPDARA
jgi:two-component system response regulator FixJ